MTLGVAILGTGRIGGSYINVVNAADGASVLVVAEPREEKVADLKAEHPEIEFVAGYQEILNRDDIDVVVGTLPHWLHHRAAIDCVNAGASMSTSRNRWLLTSGSAMRCSPRRGQMNGF